METKDFVLGFAAGKAQGGGSGSVTEVFVEPQIDDMQNGDVDIFVGNELILDSKPICAIPKSGIAGQNSSNALKVLNYEGVLANVDNWSTSLQVYSDLWIGADYEAPLALNAVVIGARTWSGVRQIYTAIFEASNDLSEWITIGKAVSKGNGLPENRWYVGIFENEVPYRYYRLRTETSSQSGYRINGSQTFTLQGLGFAYSTGGTVKPWEAFYKKDDTLYIFDLRVN